MHGSLGYYNRDLSAGGRRTPSSFEGGLGTQRGQQVQKLTKARVIAARDLLAGSEVHKCRSLTYDQFHGPRFLVEARPTLNPHKP